MAFNFRLLFRILRKSLFATQGTNARLTLRRIGVLLVLTVLYTIIETLNWLGLLLDWFLFPGYRAQKIEKPFYIIGVPRSGTTFLQRLLARDSGQFTSMRFWEIVFAPSITQKKIFRFIGRLDTLLGSPIARLIHLFERRTMADLSRIHKISFFEAEEDVYLLLHIFSSALLVFVFPFVEDLWPYFYPDAELSKRERERIMRFYKACVQRHLYEFGRGRRFLSKNPVFSGMIECLNETFPDVQFVCMVRSPLEVAPSVMSLYQSYSTVFLSTVDPAPLRQAACRLMALYYRYPLEKLQALPPQRQMVISYPVLMADLKATVEDLYRRFGLDLTPSYQQLLQDEAAKSLRYKSNHFYSLEQFGFTREQILLDFRDIFERFGFDTEG